MHLHTKAFFCTVVGNAFPQLVIADVFSVDTAVHTDAAIVVIVPLFFYLYQFLALLIGLKIKVLGIGNETVSRKCHIALHAGFAQGFGSGIGIVVQVGNRGDTEAQTLGNAQKCGSLGAAAVHLAFLLQLLGQSLSVGGIIHIAAKHGGGQMGVAVYQTGHGHHTGAVHNGGRLFFRCGLAYVSNFTVSNGNICPKEHIHFFVHSHHGDIGNQSIQNKHSL